MDTRVFVSINGALIAASTGVVLLDISDAIKAVVVFGCGIGLALVAPWLPKISENARRFMKLQNRG